MIPIEIKIAIGPGMTPGQIAHALRWLGDYFERFPDPTRYNVIALRGPAGELVGAAVIHAGNSSPPQE